MSSEQCMPARYEDKSRIFELCRHRFLLDRDRFEKIWEWMFLQNPAYHKGDPVGWKVERSGELISFIGMIPSRICVEGKVTKAYFSTSYASQEGEGIAGLKVVRKFLESEGALVFNGSAGAVSAPIFKRYNCDFIPGVTPNQFFFPFSVDPLRKNIRKKIDSLPSQALSCYMLKAVNYFLGFTAPISKVILLLLFLINTKGLKIAKLRRKYSYERICYPKEELSVIGNLCGKTSLIFVKRDHDYIKWRFFDYPISNIRVFLLFNNSSCPVDYFVLQKMTMSSTIRLLDLAYDPSEPEALKAAILFACSETRAQGTPFLLTLGHCSIVNRELSRCVLFKHKLPVSPYMFRNNDGLNQELLLDSKKWWWNPCEGDLSYDWQL